MQNLKSKPAVDSAPQSIRQSVTFPSYLHQTIEKIAETKKVSVAWVVRDAVEKYIADQWPLLDKQ